jgi:uncharacterized membrane protein
MFGIRGLDGLGLLHTALALVALLLGLTVVLRAKGTRFHRRIGQSYAVCMVLVNATALLIYDMFGGFGPFHVAALVSLATVVAGFIPVFLRRPRHSWLELHATFMAWSYVGLVAAFCVEVAVRIPGIGFGAASVAGTAIVVALGALIIHTRIPKIAAGILKSSVAANM